MFEVQRLSCTDVRIAYTPDVAIETALELSKLGTAIIKKGRGLDAKVWGFARWGKMLYKVECTSCKATGKNVSGDSPCRGCEGHGIVPGCEVRT